MRSRRAAFAFCRCRPPAFASEYLRPCAYAARRPSAVPPFRRCSITAQPRNPAQKGARVAAAHLSAAAHSGPLRSPPLFLPLSSRDCGSPRVVGPPLSPSRSRRAASCILRPLRLPVALALRSSARSALPPRVGQAAPCRRRLLGLRPSGALPPLPRLAFYICVRLFSFLTLQPYYTSFVQSFDVLQSHYYFTYIHIYPFLHLFRLSFLHTCIFMLLSSSPPLFCVRFLCPLSYVK